MGIAGIDIGTTGCKCTVYDSNGEKLGESYIEYNLGNQAGRELNPCMVWDAVKGVIRNAAGKNNHIQAIGITSFGETAVLLDQEDHPVMNSILYTDERGEEQCQRLVKDLGKEKIMSVTGLNPHSNYSISKLMWIKENKEELYHRTKHIFLYANYIVYMLSGKSVIDYSLAARTMAFDFHKLEWSQEILDAAGIDRNKLPDTVQTGSAAGIIKDTIASELGVPCGTLILSGCHDQIAAAVGTGVLSEGMAVDGAGTVECVTPVFKGSPSPEIMMNGYYATVPYILPGHYVTYAYSFTGGALLKWYRDELAVQENQEARKKGISAYDILNEKLDDIPSELLILPHFAGAATPYMDCSSRGAILGLTLETKSIEIYKALMEAVVYEMRVNIEMLKEAGIQISSLRACGGGALSAKWLQMKADILGIEITSLGAAQSGTLGCVMMAGTASGIYKHITDAEQVFVKTGKIYYPRAEKQELYNQKYKKYKKLYGAVKTFYE